MTVRIETTSFQPACRLRLPVSSSFNSNGDAAKTLHRARGVLVAAVMTATVFGSANTAWAHLGRFGRRVEWTDWNGDPVLLLNLGIMGWLYVRGLARLWRKAGVGKGVGRWQAAAFCGGLISATAVLVSPVDALSEQLAWVHMIQHMVLMTVSAPLLILGAPLFVWLWGLSPGGQRMLVETWQRVVLWRIPWRLLWHPLVTWSLYAAVLWIWHVPALYGAALRNPFVHDLQHVTFFIAGCLFWRVLLDPISRLRMGPEAGVLYLFTTTLHATVLGVFMTIAPSPWYGEYLGRTELWGLTALEDQQLAGLIMWMPACMVYLLAAVVLFVQCIERRSEAPVKSGLKIDAAAARAVEPVQAER